MKKSIVKSIMTFALLMGANGVMGQSSLSQDGKSLVIEHVTVNKLGDDIANFLTSLQLSVPNNDIESVKILTPTEITVTSDGVRGLKTNLPKLKHIDFSEATYGAVDASLFHSYTTLVSFAFPTSVKSIPNMMFYGCVNLTTVTGWDNIERIGSSVFQNCKNLVTITGWDKVKFIGSYAFKGASETVPNLLNVASLPAALEEVGSEAFINCSSLTVSVMPDGLKTIGASAFFRTGVTFSQWPSAIESIGQRAFTFSNVSFTTWPENIPVISPGVFINCPNMTEFTIPATVTEVAGGAFRFYQTDALVKTCNIYILSENMSLTTAILDGNNSKSPFGDANTVVRHTQTTLHVPASKLSAYKAANYWKSMTLKPVALSSTALTGTWSKAELEAMTISSPSLTDIDLTGITVPAGVTLSGATNPNLLIYAGASDDVTIDGLGNLIKDGAINALTIADKQPFNAPKAIAGTVTYTRPMAALQEGNPALETICLPFNATVPAGCRVMEVVEGGDAGEINLQKVTTITANTPYLIYADGTSGASVEFTATGIEPTAMADNSASANYTLKGTFANNEFILDSGVYLSDGTSFRPTADGATLKPFRAYLEAVDGTAGAPAIFVNDSGATSISEGITTEAAQPVSIYGIDGRLVQTVMVEESESFINRLPKGVYIIGQQKVVIR